MVRVGKYEYSRSTRKHKKLMVKVNGKAIHFGDSREQHFKDRTGIFASQDHNDPERRKSYLRRTANIRNKEGKLTRDDPTSANYHARRILW